MNAMPPQLPPGCEAFAKAAAALAEAHGIERFDMIMRPAFERDDYESKRSLNGEIKVSFWQTDGRGRPSRNIRVRYEAAIEIAVEYSEESSN
jgi:hypothetical protein